RISPAEVEKALQQHEAVADSIVIGVPHKMRGFVVKAFVQLRPGFDPSFLLGKDIQSFVRKNTAPYMYPRIVEFVDDLPKTINGKKCRWKMVEIENKKNNG
ncbi:acyl-CoA synthetase, partial [bacterium]|nr:acyl-CoA synthetase [bacterium]